ncbi:alpha/beta hydrolase [Nocardioides immobilis]|uniref:Alpha/beta hydrolase n=1 Tax=Nocardioides immobilis TaxID=2049295 RepID=A0A417XZ08_9ACTN|nr:alpha/beta hydrolase [Nocardioides immobilis]RHW25599.1 alpha/beta hydrolase [Nocardioides immobilis]
MTFVRTGGSRATRASHTARLLQTGLRLTFRPVGAVLPANAAGIAVIRLAFGVACLGGLHTRLPATPVETEGGAGTVRGEWVGQVPEPGEPVLLYLHGSGYVGCSPATHRGLISDLCRRLDRSAFAVRYRRAPEHRFPAAHLDVLASYLWLLERGHAPEDIVVAGDSAGGHLALALLGELRQRGVAMPGAVVAFSPVVDLTYELFGKPERNPRDGFVKRATARRILALYAHGADPRDPRLDVIQVVGPDLPPILLQVGEHEHLLAHAEGFAAAQVAAGGVCELQVWSGLFHVFQMIRPLPEAREALREVERFVARVEARRTRRTGAAAS